jgi:general secretion pathway protein L
MLESFSIKQDASLQIQQVEDLLISNELEEAPRFLLLKLESILNREMKLPLAAESNLAQVLSFEMDRQTPFRAADVYYDWKVLDRNSESGQLRLDLFVVPRPEADSMVKAVTGRGFRLAGVDVVDGSRTLGLNLLPADQRTKSVNPKTRLNLALGAACAALLGLVMMQSLYLRSHQVTGEAAGFLAKRRAEAPLAVEVLADVTQILPDDTYLDRLVISKSSVQMQGKSQNAQQLIELVNESGLLDEASFRGSTRLDARSGLEIFEVNADIVSSGGE